MSAPSKSARSRVVDILSGLPADFLDTWLSDFHWWRRRRRGHWEHWLLPQGGGPVWFHVERCSLHSGRRPSIACRGTPTCEDYPSDVITRLGDLL